MNIYCCSCEKDITARETTGEEIYSHRPDLFHLKFWVCPTCDNYVGTHTNGRPLGIIPTPKMRGMRSKIHGMLDPIWKSGIVTRSKIYADLSEEIGFEYHTAELRNMEQIDKVIKFLTGYLYK